MRLVPLYVVASTFGLCSISQTVSGQVQPSTSRTTTQTIEGHQLIVTVVSRSSRLKDDSGAWWTWGNTTDSTYLFALDRPDNVRFALVFAPSKPGRKAILIYARKDQPPMPLQQTANLTTLGNISSYPHLVITTPAPGWVTDEKASYLLKLVGDGVAGLESITSTPDGTPDFIREVTPDASGFPVRDEAKVVQNPFPNRGYPRYGLNQRAGQGATFQTWPAFMPTFPYLGAGQRRTDWFTSNPNPIYFNVASGELQFFPFTGFQTAGMYGVNSLRAEKKDFETVFALYSLRSMPPYADMVVRSRSFPAGDIFGPKPNTMTRSTFRYSWKTADPKLWTYSLGFAGQDMIISDKTDATSVEQNYKMLPSKVINTAWPAISFVQAMTGYPGSEGIYHYSAQDDQVWPSFQANPPATFILGTPIFQSDAGLRANAEHTLPLNFRGEYVFGSPQKAVLYHNDVDGLVHLLGAHEGFWYTAPQQYLHTTDLDKDGHVDSYQECQLSVPVQSQVDSATAPKSCVTQFIRLFKSAILIEKNQISIKPNLNTPKYTVVSAPTASESWNKFLNQSGQPKITSGHATDLWNGISGTIIRIPDKTVSTTSLDRKTGNLTLTLKSLTGDLTKLVILNNGTITSK